KRLTAESKLGLEWSAAALEQAKVRTATVILEEVPLPDLISALADLIGISWKMKDRVLSLSLDQEWSKEDLAIYRGELARRIVQGAILAYPGHALTPLAYVDLGILEMANGNCKEAALCFERLIREMPRSSTRLEAYYNLGLARQKTGQVIAARQAFYQ